MDCLVHPGVPAVATCAGCAESFCDGCMVEIRGQRYCSSCKSMAVSADDFGPVAEAPEAAEALKYAILGIFCIGIVLEPIAIAKAIQAQNAIKTNPQLSGEGKANAALIIGIVFLVVWVLAMLSYIT